MEDYYKKMPQRSPEEIQAELHLIARYKETSDLSILGDLYKNYMTLVYGVCLKYFKNKDESEDGVMQIFEALVEKLKTHEVNNFKSWLYVLTKNHCLMHLRSQKTKLQKINADINDPIMENSLMMHHTDGVSVEDSLVKLESCIEELQNEQKICVQLFYLEKRSYKEITETTDFDLKKVKSHIQNGKRNLKTCIERKSE